MRYGARHQGGFEFSIPPMLGGLNAALPCTAVADNEAVSEANMWVSPTGGYETRPGFAKVTSSGTSHAIEGIYYSPETGHTLVSSNGTLYSLNTGTGALTSIGTLNGTNTLTSFADFNGKTYIAHGGALQVFDGSTLSSVTGTDDPAPTDACWVKAMSTRLWVAGADSTVYWCGANDPSDWGGASPLTGGFAYIERGDGGRLTGLGLLDGMPVIFKGGSGRRKSITVCLGDTPDEFVFRCVSDGTSAASGQAIDTLNGDMLFCAEEGVHSLAMVRDYNNPKAFPLSMKILPPYTTYTPLSACSDPKRGYFYVITTRDVFAYHAGTQGWHRWLLNGITPKTVAVVSGDNVYVGASDGHVYRLSDGAYLDGSNGYQWEWATKAFDFGVPMRNKLVKWISVGYTPLSGSGSGAMSVCYRTGYGQENIASSGISVSGGTTSGWDGGFAWDTENVGWDDVSYAERKRRVNIYGANVQFGFAGTAPVKFIGVTLAGTVLGRTAGDYQNE